MNRTGSASDSPRIWLLLSDKQGDNKQVQCLADSLGYACETRVIYPLARFVRGKPWFRPSIAHIDRARSDPLEPPWPDVLLTIGRRPGMAALWIRRQSGGRTRIILIGRQPRHLREFDLVISSCQYITADDPRIMRIALPLDCNDAKRAETPSAALATAAMQTAIFIGGPTRSFRLGEREAETLLALARQHCGNAALRIVTSRRTPAVVCAWFAANLPANARLCEWAAAGAHTTSDYANALQECDRFIVTGDSISMVCDVVRQGKALAIHRLPFRNRVFALWHRFILAVAPIDDGRQRSGLLARIMKRIVDSRVLRLPRSFDAFYAYLYRNGCASDSRDGFLPAYSYMPGRDIEAARMRALQVIQAWRDNRTSGS
jgi:uncharacterized protein